MFEINAIYFFLLAEGFVLLLVLLLVWILVAFFGKRRKWRDIAKLKAGLRSGTRRRSEQTKTFLQTVYHLEGEDLNAALADINRHEAGFFEHLVASLYRSGRAQFNALGTAMDKLVESYRCLQPRSEPASEKELEAVQESATLRGENETLRNELSAANKKMNDMMSEFGDMFGGGKDHQISMSEVKERVDASNVDNDAGDSIKVQK